MKKNRLFLPKVNHLSESPHFPTSLLTKNNQYFANNVIMIHLFLLSKIIYVIGLILIISTFVS